MTCFHLATNWGSSRVSALTILDDTLNCGDLFFGNLESLGEMQCHAARCASADPGSSRTSLSCRAWKRMLLSERFGRAPCGISVRPIDTRSIGVRPGLGANNRRKTAGNGREFVPFWQADFRQTVRLPQGMIVAQDRIRAFLDAELGPPRQGQNSAARSVILTLHGKKRIAERNEDAALWPAAAFCYVVAAHE